MKRKVGIVVLLLLVLTFAAALFTAQFLCIVGCLGQRNPSLQVRQISDNAFITTEPNADRKMRTTKSYTTEKETNTYRKDDGGNDSSLFPVNERSSKSVLKHILQWRHATQNSDVTFTTAKPNAEHSVTKRILNVKENEKDPKEVSERETKLRLSPVVARRV